MDKKAAKDALRKSALKTRHQLTHLYDAQAAEKAAGQAMNLPTISRDEVEQQNRHSMELLKDAPMDMGLGIKREAPNHY